MVLDFLATQGDLHLGKYGSIYNFPKGAYPEAKVSQDFTQASLGNFVPIEYFVLGETLLEDWCSLGSLEDLGGNSLLQFH